jgi:nitrite reductase (NADH) small subunit
MLRDLGSSAVIPAGEGRVFQVGSERVAVFRTRHGELFATQADCPHRGGPLADGIVGAGRVICPLHAFQFDLRTGEAVKNTCEPLRTYAVSESSDGRILLGPARERAAPAHA